MTGWAAALALASWFGEGVAAGAVARDGRAAGDKGAALRTAVGGCDVDWAAGTITARAGAAADRRLPAPDLARPGAVRRARAAAEARLREALGALPLGGGRRLDAAAIGILLGRARADADYQSDGGVLMALTARFSDLGARGDGGVTPAAACVLETAAAALEAAPVLVAGDVAVAPAWAVYRIGAAPRDAAPMAATRDGQGRLVVAAGEGARRCAGAGIVVHARRIVR